MTRPSAWIFDFNGTLVFDSIYHEQAWNRYMEGRLGRVVPREEFLAHVHGRTNRDILTYLLGRCPTQAEADAEGEAKEDLYRQLCRGAGPAYRLVDGAAALLDRLAAENIPFAIATSSTRPNVEFYFEQLGLARWFTPERVIFSGPDMPGKPDPAIYRLTMQRLGVDPAACVVLEDAPAGIRSALAAGAGQVVGIGETGEGRAQLAAAFPELPVIADYNDARIACLLPE